MIMIIHLILQCNFVTSLSVESRHVAVRDDPHRVAALLVDDHTCGVALVPGLYVQSPSSPVQGVLLTEVNKLHSHYLRRQDSLLSACGTEYPDLYKKNMSTLLLKGRQSNNWLDRWDSVLYFSSKLAISSEMEDPLR